MDRSKQICRPCPFILQSSLRKCTRMTNWLSAPKSALILNHSSGSCSQLLEIFHWVSCECEKCWYNEILDVSSKFLNDLLILGARQLYDYYEAEIRQNIFTSSKTPDCNVIMALLDHYSTQKNPRIHSLVRHNFHFNLRYFFDFTNFQGNIARYLKEDNFERFIGKSTFSHSDKETLRKYGDNGYQIFVKMLDG